MLDLCCCVDFFAESLAIALRECPQAQFYEAAMRGDLSFWGQFDAAICIAGFVHLSDAELPGVFRSLAVLLPAGAPLLLTVKATRVYYDIVPDGGTIDLVYDICIENAEAGVIDYHLDIRAK